MRPDRGHRDDPPAERHAGAMLCDRATGHPIGLVAGWGRLPLTVAASLARQGHEVVGVGISQHADQAIAAFCRAYQEFGLARLGAQIRYFLRRGVRRVVFAGKIQKSLLFRRDFIWRNMPDLCCVRAYFQHFVTRRRDRSDDSLLLAAVQAYQRNGIQIVPASSLVPDLMIRPGRWTGRPVTTREEEDIAFGWRMAKEIGRLDIGQTVAVKGQAVLAVEAIEGTDACIQRAGKLCASGGFVVVKVAKPQQDMRFDVPTIGSDTIHTLHTAGASVLAVEAERTILLDAPDVADLAARYKIAIVAIRDGRLADDSCPGARK